MGCDIHFFREYLDVGTDKWVSYDLWYSSQRSLSPEANYTSLGRNYAAFGLLASVRTEYPYGLKAKGIPDDASDLVKNEFESWEVDAHTPTYLTDIELNELALKLTLMETLTGIDYSDVTRQNEYLHKMIAYLNNTDAPTNVGTVIPKRMIMWFDN